jgi:uncharacterized protein YvpB
MKWEASHRKKTCQMKQQTEREQIHWLSVKTIKQVFIARACEGLSCSMFEAQARKCAISTCRYVEPHR